MLRRMYLLLAMVLMLACVGCAVQNVQGAQTAPNAATQSAAETPSAEPTQTQTATKASHTDWYPEGYPEYAKLDANGNVQRTECGKLMELIFNGAEFVPEAGVAWGVSIDEVRGAAPYGETTDPASDQYAGDGTASFVEADWGVSIKPPIRLSFADLEDQLYFTRYRFDVEGELKAAIYDWNLPADKAGETPNVPMSERIGTVLKAIGEVPGATVIRGAELLDSAAQPDFAEPLFVVWQSASEQTCLFMIATGAATKDYDPAKPTAQTPMFMFGVCAADYLERIEFEKDAVLGLNVDGQ